MAADSKGERGYSISCVYVNYPWHPVREKLALGQPANYLNVEEELSLDSTFFISAMAA
jgi:hypothetical protein